MERANIVLLHAYIQVHTGSRTQEKARKQPCTTHIALRPPHFREANSLLAQLLSHHLAGASIQGLSPI